jgi:tetratricopeptide (TPR) repeat protein
VEWLDRLLAAETAGRDEQSLEPDRIVARQIARGKALNAAYWNKSHVGQSDPRLVEESVAIFKAFGDVYLKDLAYSLYLSGTMDFQESVELFRKVGDQFYLTEVLFHLAAALLRSGDLVQARIYFEERQELCKEREDLEGEGFGLWELGLLDFLQGNTNRAVEFFIASRALLRASNQEFFAFVIRFQAWIALAQGYPDEAIRFSEKELAAAQEYAISWVTVDALGFLGWEARVLGDDDLAVRRCEEALRLAHKVGHDFFHIAHYVLGRVAITRKQYASASTYLKELITHFEVFESPHNAKIEYPPVHLGIQVFGILAAAQAGDSTLQARRATILFGAQASMVGCLMNIIPPTERLEYEHAVASVRTTLGEEAFTTAWAEGQALTLEQAVAYALEE